MIRRPACCRRLNPLKSHLGQIERIDKHVDHANRVALINEIVEAFGQQRYCPRSASSTKRPMNVSQESPENHNSGTAFSHSQGQKAKCRADQRTSALAPMADISRFVSTCPGPALTPESS